MTNGRNNSKQDQEKNLDTQENQASKEQTSSKPTAGERMTDGTNDFKNGDQEPSSEQASETGERS